METEINYHMFPSLKRSLYLLPAVDTAKGTFYIRNFMNEETKQPGVIIFNEQGEFITERINMKYKEDDDFLIDRMIAFIEKSSLF